MENSQLIFTRNTHSAEMYRPFFFCWFVLQKQKKRVAYTKYTLGTAWYPSSTTPPNPCPYSRLCPLQLVQSLSTSRPHQGGVSRIGCPQLVMEVQSRLFAVMLIEESHVFSYEPRGLVPYVKIFDSGLGLMRAGVVCICIYF